MTVSLGTFLESQILKAQHRERSGMHWTRQWVVQTLSRLARRG